MMCLNRCVLTCLLLGVGPALGQEPPVEDLEGLLDVKVVSGVSRGTERADDAPATSTVITADELRRYGLRTVAEAINFLSVGMVAQDPLHAVEVGSRGVLLSSDFGNHMLVIVDGHTLNEQWNGTAYFEQGLGIPMELIDHLELIVGPGSVHYGSSAMLGVINVVTRRAGDLGQLQLTAEGSVLPPQGADGAPLLRWAGLGSTGRLSALAGYQATLAGEPFEVTFGAEYYAHRGQALTFAVQSGLTESDGHRTWAQQWGPRAPGPGSWGGTTTDSWWTQVPSGLLKVRWGDVSLWARAALYARNTPALDAFGISTSFDGEAKEVDRWVNLELRWARSLAANLQVLVRAYVDLYDYRWATESSSWVTRGGDASLPGDLDPANLSFRIDQQAGSRWGGLEAQATWDWLGDGRFPLLAGADARLRHFESATKYATDSALLDNANNYAADEWRVAVYVQQRARFHPRLSLNVGARLDVQSSIPPRLSPRIALVWITPSEGRLKLVLNSAFRSPSGFERFAQYSTQIRNPALTSESVKTAELSYEQRLGRHRFFLGAFVSQYANLIRLAPVPGLPGPVAVSWYENQGSIINVGGSATLEGTIGSLSYGVSFTGAVNQTDQPLVASPGWFGNARVSWDFGAGAPRVSLASSISGARLITAASATGLDSAGQTVGWDPGTQMVGPQAELRASVDSPLGVAGLWLRGVVGASLTPFSAYTVGARQSPEEGFTTPAQMPNSRLFLMLTLGWSLDPP